MVDPFFSQRDSTRVLHPVPGGAVVQTISQITIVDTFLRNKGIVTMCGLLAGVHPIPSSAFAKRAPSICSGTLCACAPNYNLSV